MDWLRTLGSVVFTILIVYFIFLAGLPGLLTGMQYTFNPSVERFLEDWQDRFGRFGGIGISLPTLPAPPPAINPRPAPDPQQQASAGGARNAAHLPALCPDGSVRPDSPGSYPQVVNGRPAVVTRHPNCRYTHVYMEEPPAPPAPAVENLVHQLAAFCSGPCEGRFAPLTEADGTVNPLGIKLKAGPPVKLKIPEGFSADVWDCKNTLQIEGPWTQPSVCEATVRKR